MPCAPVLSQIMWTSPVCVRGTRHSLKNRIIPHRSSYLCATTASACEISRDRRHVKLGERRVYGFRQRRGIIRPHALPPQPHVLLAAIPLAPAGAGAGVGAEGHHAPTPAREPRAIVQPLATALVRLEHGVLGRKAARGRGWPKVRTVRDGRLLRREACRDVLHGAQRAELRDGCGVRVAEREAVRL